MSFKLLSAVLRGTWLIDPDFAQAHLPLVENLITGKLEGFTYKPDKNLTAFAAHPLRLSNRHSSFNDAPKGSIAIIPVMGPIMKNDYCGDAGSMTRAYQINEANNHPNIDAIILEMDSPGGMVDGTQTFADAIKSTTKPIIAIINEGMSASAAYWLASQCDEIYVSQKTDMVGSIGVYTSFADYTKYYEEKGIKIHEIYAPQSTEKNKDYKDAKKGDYSDIEKDLSYIADTFINAVKEGRGSKLNLSAGDPFKGKMYFADDAMAIGLIDGIKTMDQVIERAVELSKPQQSNQTTTNMNTEKYTALNAVLGVATLEASEEGVFLNEQQLDAIEAGLVPDSTLVSAETHQAIVEELATAKTNTTTTNNALAALAADAGVEVAEGEINAVDLIVSIQAKVAELKTGSSASHTSTNADGDAVDLSKLGTMLDNMPHNRDADNL